MSSCLGLYIEPNIIKYAKVSKEHENLKVEAFGIKFYDKIGEAIKQIINDTYSFKVPISINLSEEIYQYFYMFNLLNKNDLKKAIETEFEALCLEKNINPNALEHRYALVNSQEEKDKIKVIHISANKNVINTIEQPFAEYRVSTLSSIGTSISNVANIKQKENVVIVNMEEQTTFTTIIDQKIYQVDKIEEGAKKVLDSINIKENSYSKAYEICKNSTIYTMEGKELQEETNEYLDDIMPTLYKIASSLQEKLQESTIKIDKIYLTGTLSVINNVDLYFQEFFKNEKCEILKPFFIKETVKINIKDYVQVNSAIGLALQGLDYGIKDMNFKKKTLKDSIDSLTSKLNIEIGEGKGKTKINFDKNINLSLKGKLDRTEAWMLRTLTGVLLLIGIYSAFAVFLNYSITNKNKEVEEVKKDTQTQIASVEKDIQTIKSKTNNYEQMSNNLKNINEQAAEKSKNKKVIPNLLSEIQFAIPQGVQITSIENTSGRHIVINAQSTKYEQLGYFKAVLRLQGILEPDTIVSSPGEKQNDLVKVVIEGDLP
ncbi:MAG: hypothetical protein ACI4UU_01040 [Clostridia bacterium]